MPATCGVDMDVPDTTWKATRHGSQGRYDGATVPVHAAIMPTPSAITSGCMRDQKIIHDGEQVVVDLREKLETKENIKDLQVFAILIVLHLRSHDQRQPRSHHRPRLGDEARRGPWHKHTPLILCPIVRCNKTEWLTVWI